MDHTTTIYKGWLTFAPSQRERDETLILTPNRFFSISKNHVLIEKIKTDLEKFGPYVNIRIWAYHAKMEPLEKYFSHSMIGFMNAEYKEICGANRYYYTNQFMRIDSIDLLEKLVRYDNHYCIIEIAYHLTEDEMVSHEMEMILLRNRSS